MKWCDKLYFLFIGQYNLYFSAITLNDIYWNYKTSCTNTCFTTVFMGSVRVTLVVKEQNMALQIPFLWTNKKS